MIDNNDPIVAATAAAPAFGLDHLWVLSAAILVFFMQAGFFALEVGFVRRHNVESVAFKNVVDYLVSALGFYLLGFGLMFGHNLGGLIGTDLFAWNGAPVTGGSQLGMVFLLFQLAFASTAVTIVSGATAERIRFTTYLVGAAVTGVIIYPVFGHWAWGNMFFADNKTWLTELGFVDFAGSTVVHSVGGWVALVAAMLLGPRRGRYDAHGRVQAMPGYSQVWAVLGVFILWFGWWGFNGGSTLALNADVGPIVLNTNLAGAAGGLIAFLHARQAQGGEAMKDKMLGGILGGLVAITANCHMVSPISAIAIGGLAGILHNVVYDRMLHRWRIDDPVGAIPVHLACGVFGTLCVALFGNVGLFPHGHGRFAQFGVQLVGVLACAAWAGGSAWVLYRVLARTIGLRVDERAEAVGVDLVEQPMASPSLSSLRPHRDPQQVADDLIEAMLFEPHTVTPRPNDQFVEAAETATAGNPRA
jgi:ammonium transporter, Amt family